MTDPDWGCRPFAREGVGAVRVLRALLYGYAGAVLAGLLVGFAGAGFGLAHETVVSTATIFGTIFGLAGLGLAWWPAPAAARGPR